MLFSEPVEDLENLYYKVGHQGEDLIYKSVRQICHLPPLHSRLLQHNYRD